MRRWGSVVSGNVCRSTGGGSLGWYVGEVGVGYADSASQTSYVFGEGESTMLDRLFRRDRGQGLVEYALIIALVAVVVIATLILLGPQIRGIFGNISNNL